MRLFFVRDVHANHGVERLATMLNKTTSLLPDALFASLGMPRTDQSIVEAKHVSLDTLQYSYIRINLVIDRALTMN